MKIAVCGLDCAICPAYIVHVTGDNDLRMKTAEQWAKEYGAEITPAMVDCVGCTDIEGPHIGHCFECEIRTCGLARGVAHCALCDVYPCAVISGFIEKVPPAKANLEMIRSGRAAEAKAETKTEPEAKTERKPKAKPKIKPRAKTKLKAKPKPKAKPKAKAKAKPKTKSKIKVKPKAKAKLKAKAKARPKPKAKGRKR